MKNKLKLMIVVCISCVALLGGTMSVFAAGALTIALSSSSVDAGDTVTVTVYAKGADNEDVTSDMNITYDSSKLEYVSASGAGATGGGGSVKATGSTVNIKFKAVGSGDAYVKAEGATLTAAGAHIMVGGAAADSDDDADDTDDEDASDENGTKSGDNSLSSLKISPGTLSPAFKGSTTQYTATVEGDVNELTVTPVTSNSNATVESVSGNKNLKVGENVITVLVKAENGTKATYKIVVTKKDSVSASAENTTTSNDEAKTDNSEVTMSETAENGDNIIIGDIKYKISEDFTDEDIPEDFSRADFEYKGAPYKGVVFDYGHLGMYYLENESGESGFFVYDADRDVFYPYVRLDSGEHFIILMGVPNGAIPPDDYEGTTLTINESVTIQAYQYAGEVDEDRIVLDENGEKTSDFYVVFAMDNTGVAGWYQYDFVQGTYQRLNEETKPATDSKADYDVLLESYNDLSERHKDTKATDRRIIIILIFVSVVMLIVIINLLLKIRELGMEEDEGETAVEKVKKKIKKERPDRNIYVKVPEPKEEDDFYEDTDDFMDEFEEDPGLLSRRPKKKEKPLKKENPKPEWKTDDDDDDDDDIEFFDLNNL